jgi:hypothetical protein
MKKECGQNVARAFRAQAGFCGPPTMPRFMLTEDPQQTGLPLVDDCGMILGLRMYHD